MVTAGLVPASRVPDQGVVIPVEGQPANDSLVTMLLSVVIVVVVLPKVRAIVDPGARINTAEIRIAATIIAAPM